VHVISHRQFRAPEVQPRVSGPYHRRSGFLLHEDHLPLGDTTGQGRAIPCEAGSVILETCLWP
jgi:hypothetical protein